MGEIRLLPDEVVNRIAAGEVVERPASVAKELMENALDAGAGAVDVVLQKGGRKLVEVRDDGTGMSRHDLLLAVQRHATSKIRTAGDLDSLSTLGFRGEALPSIAAVCHFTVVTSPDGEEGWKLRMDGGKLKDVSPAPRARGTTVSAGGLFYNQPARRRFLRSASTELSWVQRFVTGAALSRLDVSFSLRHNGRSLFGLPAGQGLRERLLARYRLGGDVRVVEGEGAAGGTSASVLVVPDQRWRGRRNQYVLVNGRLIRSPMVSAIAGEELGGPAGHPLLVVSLSLPGEEVDVNAHPTKREIRFRDRRAVEAALRSALSGLPGARTEQTVESFSRRPGGGGGYSRSKTGRATTAGSVEERSGLFEAAMELQRDRATSGSDEPARYRGCGVVQVGKSYLVSAVSTGIVVVDQHAAHERILFERILKGDETGELSSQALLLPESIHLEPEEIETLRRYAVTLRRVGFGYSMEEDRLVLYAVPEGVSHGVEALMEVLRSPEDARRAELPEREQLAAAAACAGAVKAGDRLTPEESAELMDMLFSTGDPFHCPHGRPTLIEIPFSELESRFGR
jgi:DNA mismatch repair protein MutL